MIKKDTEKHINKISGSRSQYEIQKNYTLQYCRPPKASTINVTEKYNLKEAIKIQIHRWGAFWIRVVFPFVIHSGMFAFYRFLLILLCGLLRQQSPLFCSLPFYFIFVLFHFIYLFILYFLFFFLLTITRSGRLAEIWWSVCISKSQGTCVSHSPWQILVVHTLLILFLASFSSKKIVDHKSVFITPIFRWYSSKTSSVVYTHTHTHTHTYIYIYIYI